MDKSINQTTISTSPSSCEEEESDYLHKNFDITFLSKVIQAITRVLSKNEKRKSYKKIIRKQLKMVFSSAEIPLISLQDYLVRIVQMIEIEEETIVTALIYLDRLCKNKVALIQHNIHKLLFTAIMIAIKYNHDTHYSNKGFSYIAGIPLEDMNLMEYTFLNLIGYDLFIPEDFFTKYHNYLTDISLKDY